MQVELLEIATRQIVSASIDQISLNEAPLKKDGWNFTWRDLVKTEGSSCYRIALSKSPQKAEGMVMLSVYFEEMVVMNNLEAAPWNIGKDKQYDRVAGSLLAFACRFSLEHGRGNYQGFLAFDSKTELIPLYQEKYGAISAGGLKMFIEPAQGERLIQTYLSPHDSSHSL